MAAPFAPRPLGKVKVNHLQVLDQLAMQDRQYRRETARILRLQRDLRGLVGGEAWRVYLELEEATNRRLARVVELAVGAR
jgi:hypothetical protein